MNPEKRYTKTLYQYAMSFRSIALAIDQDPCQINQYREIPAIQFLLSDRESTALERTQYLEALSYGDPGVLLASPGPSLSGLALRELGTKTQAETFYDMLQQQYMHTFFGLTEIEKGSDAANIETRLTEDPQNNEHYILSGQKCFCGNAAIAKTGVVFARVNDGPAGIRAIWLTPELLNSDAVIRETLTTAVLRGAQLGGVEFNKLVVNKSDHVLGNHLSTMNRGLLAIVRIFNQFRTGVGAIAIGQAQALLDYVSSLPVANTISLRSQLSTLQDKVNASRLLLHKTAFDIETYPDKGVLVSIAKINAIKTTEFVTSNVFKLLPPDVIVDSPWLCKVFRDQYCWEFMEGASDVLMTHVQNHIELWLKNQGVL